MEKKALALADKHQTFFSIKYPFTYATQELPPSLEFDVRSLPAKVKGPVRILVEEELLGVKEGAPGGWRPGKDWEEKFKPDATGLAPLRPITADMRFTAHLLNADSVEVAQAKLDLPVVLYEPSATGSVTVVVYGMGEKGDSTEYIGAEVTLDKTMQTTGPNRGTTTFGSLKPGSYSVSVKPSKGDERHGPGNGSGAFVDAFLSKDPKATNFATITVRLPYIPEKKIADKPDDKKPGTGTGNTGNTNTKAKDSTSTNKVDSTSSKATKDSAAANAAAIEAAIAKLTPITSKAEKARDDAKAACQYIEAAKAQRELVTAARNFLASSFPKGVPAQLQSIAEGYNAELAALEKAAKAQEQANVFLREGLAAVRTKHAEPALAALEKAADVDGIPQCLHDQVMKLYNEIKTDLEKRMKIIEQATDAANVKCDYAAALKFGQEVEAEYPNLSWVLNELPRIRDLNKRQQNARTLAAQAEAKAAEAEGLAQAGGDLAQANALFDTALELARQALAAAPACDKENFKNLLDLPARKAAMTTPSVDQSLVLLLDVSGSMRDNNKMDNAKQAATDAVKSLGPTTEVALISYDGACAGGYRVVQGFTTNRQSLITAIAGLSPGGGTPTAPAVGFASDYLQKTGRGKSGQIMLMTDGQNDCGSMVDAGSGLRRSAIPIRIDAVGFGLGEGSNKAQDDLGALVRAAGGGGSTYSANSAKELISAFRRAFISNQLKVRDPFVSGEAGTRLSSLFSAAIEFLKANNLTGAMNQLQAAATQFPTSAAAAYNVSLGYEAAGQPLQAMNYAKKYLDLAPRAFDAGQVRARIDVLEKEQAANPRAIYSPTDCSEMYRWAQRESRLPRLDAARKVKVLDIMTTEQRGDCATAKAAQDKYFAQYGK
jgi:Mg-chelatase subunit ChlD